MRRTRPSSIAFLVAFVMGCAAPSPVVECEHGSDCASGICADGACVEETSATGTSSATGAGGAGGSTNASTGPSMTGTGGSIGCANHDGVIERSEVPIAAGLTAKFGVATNLTFATSGTLNGNGTRDWNMVGPYSGDHLDLVETLPLAGQWFEAAYPGATYAARLADSSDLLGVFEVTNDALLLRGVVSPADGFTKTELTYTPAVPALEFPLTDQKAWAITSTVTGYAQGVFVTYTEGYDFLADAKGTLETPFGTFEVERVRSTLTRTVGLLVTVVRSYAFAAECFGTVATVTSQDNEPNAEFSSASELRRLAP